MKSGFNTGGGQLQINLNNMAKTLKTTHNAGFFSCSTIALMDIVNFTNEHKEVPFRWDRKDQYHIYKPYPNLSENLIPYYFSKAFEKALPIQVTHIDLPDCMAIQFGAYRNLNFTALKPYVNKYFTPSANVMEMFLALTHSNKLHYGNLCGVFYRGNDKAREMKIAGYDVFIERARVIKAEHPTINFLVQTDENEFLTAFLNEFPDSIYFLDLPRIDKQNTSVTDALPQSDRKLFGAQYFAAVICLSRCKHIITHSGNGALWMALYRGHGEGINQIHNGEWI